MQSSAASEPSPESCDDYRSAHTSMTPESKGCPNCSVCTSSSPDRLSPQLTGHPGWGFCAHRASDPPQSLTAVPCSEFWALNPLSVSVSCPERLMQSQDGHRHSSSSVCPQLQIQTFHTREFRQTQHILSGLKFQKVTHHSWDETCLQAFPGYKWSSPSSGPWG